MIYNFRVKIDVLLVINHFASGRGEEVGIVVVNRCRLIAWAHWEVALDPMNIGPHANLCML